MLDDVPPPVPPLVATNQAATPSPDLPPAGEAKMPPPTVEQAQAADHVFTSNVQRHPLASLLGIAASVGMLRDVTIENFETSDEEEEDDPDADKDRQP